MYFQTASLLLAIAPACMAKLPVVDLGYELHQAISLSVSRAEQMQGKPC